MPKQDQPLRSDAQKMAVLRRYYWAVIRYVAPKTLPHLPKKDAELALHDELKGIILGYADARLPDGTVQIQPISTADLVDPSDFSQYIEAVISLAAQSGIDFPEDGSMLLEVQPASLPCDLPLSTTPAY